MQVVRYFHEYSKDKEYFYDWRVQALNILEPTIIFFCQNHELERLRGIDFDDIAQDLRFLIWRELPKFNPKRSSIKTWASVRIRSYLGDVTNPLKYKTDILDSKKRKSLPASYI